jgi:hypothetical protein
LDHIVNQALAKDRDRRYQSAAAIREDLQRLKSTLASPVAVETTPSSSAQRRPSPIFRRNLWKILTTAIAILATILVGYGLLRARKATPNATAFVLYPRRSVAIIGFDNLNGHGDREWGGSASRPIPADAPAATTILYSRQKMLCFSANTFAIA